MVKLYLDIKTIRAQVIKEYLGNDKCFCFSCGNATKALIENKVNVIPISSKDKLCANQYIDPQTAKQYFGCFDATSGCLPIFLIKQIAEKVYIKLPAELFTNTIPIYIPTGSGETALAFGYIFNINRLVLIKDSNNPSINFNKQYSPLYDFITVNYKVININQFDNNKPGYLINQPYHNRKE